MNFHADAIKFLSQTRLLINIGMNILLLKKILFMQSKILAKIVLKLINNLKIILILSQPKIKIMYSQLQIKVFVLKIMGQYKKSNKKKYPKLSLKKLLKKQLILQPLKSKSKLIKTQI